MYIVLFYVYCVVLCIIMLFYVSLCCSMYISLFSLLCVVLCIVCVYMCTVLLPPGGYPIAVNRYISLTYHIISYHIISTPGIMLAVPWTWPHTPPVTRQQCVHAAQPRLFKLLQNVRLIKHSGHITSDLTVFQQLTCATWCHLSLNGKSMLHDTKCLPHPVPKTDIDSCVCSW